MKNRLLHIYCGAGKGKTTAATGLAVRAAGSSMRVLFARFLKNEFSGELKILDQIPEIEVLHLEKSYGFFKTLSEKEQEEVREMYGRLWNSIQRKISTGDYDMLVIDEFMAAYRYGLIPNEEAVQFLKDRPDNLEVVLTGRDPSDELLELADYISEVKMVRHPFEKGIRARKGIEY
jgi:cob(I)alamin adenosyltransferase